jgi:hypothetical protein
MNIDKKHCKPGSHEHTVAVKTPHWLYETKTEVMIDKCVVPEIEYLWSLGIRTYGCCCGHGKQVAMVNVHPDDAQKMLEMDYIGGLNKFGAMTFAMKTQQGSTLEVQ